MCMSRDVKQVKRESHTKTPTIHPNLATSGAPASTSPFSTGTRPLTAASVAASRASAASFWLNKTDNLTSLYVSDYTVCIGLHCIWQHCMYLTTLYLTKLLARSNILYLLPLNDPLITSPVTTLLPLAYFTLSPCSSSNVGRGLRLGSAVADSKFR